MDGPPDAASRAPRWGDPVRASRTLPSSVERLWDLWTTPEGFASWWGPEDSRTSVERWELRVGGEIRLTLRYASAVEHPEFGRELERSGVATTYTARGQFTEVVPLTRLSFRLSLRYGPRAPPVLLTTRADFRAVEGGVRLTVDSLGSATKHWRTLAQPALEGELDRLSRVLARSLEAPR